MTSQLSHRSKILWVFIMKFIIIKCKTIIPLAIFAESEYTTIVSACLIMNIVEMSMKMNTISTPTFLELKRCNLFCGCRGWMPKTPNDFWIDLKTCIALFLIPQFSSLLSQCFTKKTFFFKFEYNFRLKFQFSDESNGFDWNNQNNLSKIILLASILSCEERFF